MQARVKGMPDLSFYPENYLIAKAFDNPVSFGQKQKKDIGELVDIADLSILPFESAKPGIEKALDSEDEWQRYWGLIVCSCFGKAAESFADEAKKLADNDDDTVEYLQPIH